MFFAMADLNLNPLQEPAAEASAPVKAPPPASHSQPQADANEEDSSGARRMDRPRTARRAPPKVQTNVAPKDTRPTSKQSDSRGAVKVIAEGDAVEDDDDDAGDLSAVQVGAGQRGIGQGRHEMDGDHGMLVKKMMQKEQALVSNEGSGQHDQGAIKALHQTDNERQRTVVSPFHAYSLFSDACIECCSLLTRGTCSSLWQLWSCTCGSQYGENAVPL